jgi:mono/diheme cytochrome c family protein
MNRAERERIIRFGKGLMPPQKDVLTDAEIAGIAAYLDTFLAAK